MEGFAPAGPLITWSYKLRKFRRDTRRGFLYNLFIESLMRKNEMMYMHNCCGPAEFLTCGVWCCQDMLWCDDGFGNLIRLPIVQMVEYFN